MARVLASGDSIHDGVVRIHKHTSAAKALTWGLLPRQRSFPSLAGKVMEGI